MTPRIVVIPPRRLVGMRARMSLAADATPALWRAFMPRRHEVRHRVNDEYLSVRIYDRTDDDMFAPATEHEKWAAVEVADDAAVPEGMERHELVGGRYAVFVHEGPAHTFPDTMRYIFATWLPSSGYRLDHREHFEVLQEGYDPADPNGREEVWVPLQ